jgi:hypothetical protein
LWKLYGFAKVIFVAGIVRNSEFIGFPEIFPEMEELELEELIELELEELIELELEELIELELEELAGTYGFNPVYLPFTFAFGWSIG